MLVLLPDDIWSLAEDSAAVERWKKMAAAICGRDMPCIDLSEPFMRTPAADWDRGYDGSHYGPRANRVIATLLEEQLAQLGALK